MIDDYARGVRAADASVVQMQREPRVARGELHAEPGYDIRKIDGLVRHEAAFTELARNATVVSIMQALIGEKLELYRATVLLKLPGVGSAKGLHQDSPYWPIDPPALWSCWVAFDPAVEENGCMTAVPGSHKLGMLPHSNVTDDFILDPELEGILPAVPVPMRPGSGLFFHSLTLHGTAANVSAYPRRAITMSYMGANYAWTRGPRPEFLAIP